MPAEDVRTPCQLDPAKWDIPVPADEVEAVQARANVHLALAGCGTCPIRSDCLDLAYSDPPQHRCVMGGRVWSGQRDRGGPEENWRIQARRADLGEEEQPTAESPISRCGTYPGFKAHERAGNRACDRCREARTAYQRRWRQGRASAGRIAAASAQRRELARELAAAGVPARLAAKRMHCTERTAFRYLAAARAELAGVAA